MVKKIKVNDYDKVAMRTGVIVLSLITTMSLLIGLLIGKLIWG